MLPPLFVLFRSAFGFSLEMGDRSGSNEGSGNGTKPRGCVLAVSVFVFAVDAGVTMAVP